MPKLYNLVVKDLEGNDVSLENYRGQVLLIVNTASECGFAKQNKGLQKLQDDFQDEQFTVLAFPSDSFDQEPKNAQELREYFVDENVSFPVFSKVNVLGEERDELFNYLTELEPKEWLDTPENDKSYEFQREFHGGYWGKDITWNYNKFLINQEGVLVGRYASFVDPADLHSRIENLLHPENREETYERTLEEGELLERREGAAEDDEILEPPIIVPPVSNDPTNPGTPHGPVM